MKSKTQLTVAAAIFALSLHGAQAYADGPVEAYQDGAPLASTLDPNEYVVNADGAKEDPDHRMSDIARAYRNGYINRGKTDDAILKQKLADQYEADHASTQREPPIPPGMPNGAQVAPVQNPQVRQRPLPPPAQYAQEPMAPAPSYAPEAPEPVQYQQPVYRQPVYEQPVYEAPPVVVQQVYAPPPPPVQYVYQQPAYVPVQPVVAVAAGWPVYRPAYYAGGWGYGGFRRWR